MGVSIDHWQPRPELYHRVATHLVIYFIISSLHDDKDTHVSGPISTFLLVVLSCGKTVAIAQCFSLQLITTPAVDYS